MRKVSVSQRLCLLGDILRSLLKARIYPLLKKLPAEARLLITADEFDYSLQPIPLPENGIDHLPSVGFANPVEAFEAGERFAKEVAL